MGGIVGFGGLTAFVVLTCGVRRCRRVRTGNEKASVEANSYVENVTPPSSYGLHASTIRLQGVRSRDAVVSAVNHTSI